MSQRHLDRLTAVDAGFLHEEDRGPAHMQIGGLVLLDGPLPAIEDVRRSLAARLLDLPRYRQRLLPTPLGLARPVWADDPAFDIGQHVLLRHLPAPGTFDQLLELTGDLMSQRLGRGRSMWQLDLVDGLEGGRGAIVARTHHSLVDGVGGMDLLAALFDVEPAPAEPSPAASEEAVSGLASKAGPHPSPLTLLVNAAVDSTRIATDMSAAILSRLRQPELALRDATWAIAGLAGVAGKFVNSAPRSVLNIPVGSMRLVATVSRPLAEVKAVKSALGGTVNDVCLAAVAGALRTFLAERGDQSIEQPEAGRFRAMIPVSIRQGTGRQELGNKLVAMVAALPVDVGDARARLQAVRDTTARLKASPEQDGAAFLAAVEELAPPQVVAQASRLNFSSRLYNLMVTNIAGPQFPIYLLGRRVERIFPLGFLGMHHNLCVAILSYNGEINVGLLGDREAVPDIARVARHLEHAFDELRDAV